MSLLPAAMQIKDDMPMTLGQAVKRALDPKTPIDSIRAFEIGEHEPINQCDGCRQGATLDNGLHRDRNGRAFMGCQAHRYTKREPTLDEMPEALRQHVGECCTEAIRADEPKPKFKAGDRFIVGRQHREYFVDEVFVATKVQGDQVWFHRDGRDGFFFDFNIELLPSPKQEGEQ